MRLFVNHRTEYRFSVPQQRVIQLARVVPASFAGQTVLDWSVGVDCDARIRSGRDGYGNDTRMIYVDGPIDHVVLTVTGEVLTEDRAGVVSGAPEPLPPLVFERETPLTTPDEPIRALGAGIHADAHGTLDRMHLLMQRLRDGMTFDTGDMDVRRTASDAYALKHGVCQDFAHVFVAAARTIGVPARYVSGHLYLRGSEDGQAAAHAWAEACVEDLGWVAFDPANGVCPDDAYVRVAVGLDYRDAAPVAGARTGGGGEMLDVSVRVNQERREGSAQRQN